MKTVKKVNIGCLFLIGWVFLGSLSLHCSNGVDSDSVLKLVGSLMQLPAILTTDNEDSLDVKVATGLALFGVDGKILYELFKEREKTSLFKDYIYHTPKIMLYGVTNLYDYLRLKYPAPVLKDNEQAKTLLKNVKWIQLIIFCMEIALRLGTLYISYKDSDEHGFDKKKIFCNELADWLEIGRLFTCYYLLKTQMPAEVGKKLDQNLSEIKTKLAAVFQKPRQV
jgi:hypothetical protein